MSKNGVTIKEVYELIQRVEAKIDDRFDDLDDKYVSRNEFWPVRAIVYGGTSVILLTVMGLLVSMVVIK